ncbi:MAG: SMP-30/gluconolactonase/LRE family protein [Coriobacteriia bacterium]
MTPLVTAALLVALAVPVPGAAETFETAWGGSTRFQQPCGVAVGSTGQVYVVDRYNHRVQRFTASGTFLAAWGSSGSGHGSFIEPDGIAIAPDGSVYVADSGNARVQKFTATGGFVRDWGVVGTGAGQFRYPTGVAVDASGTVWVADGLNGRIQAFDANGRFLRAVDGLAQPHGIAVDASGTLYVADTGNGRIAVFDREGTPVTSWDGSDSALGALSSPMGVAVNPRNGLVYVADTNGNRIQKFSTGGAWVWGWGQLGSAQGRFNHPYALAFSRAGDLYVCDQNNNRIEKFVPDVVSPATQVSGIPSGGWSSHDVSLTLGAFDAGSGVASSYIRVGAGELSTYAAPTVVSAEGATTIAFFSTDHDGNVEPARTATVLIDRVAPAASLAASGTYLGRAHVSVTGTDAASGVASTWWRVDDGPWTRGNDAMTSVPGPHTITAYALDRAGNRSSDVSIDTSVRAVGLGATLRVAPDTRAYGARVTVNIACTIADEASSAPLPGATARFWRSTNGRTWSPIATRTADAAGGVVFAQPLTLTVRTLWRITSHETTSATLEVLPRAYLAAPTVPAYARRNVRFVASGLLKPRHRPGTYPVIVDCYRYEDGRWVLRSSVLGRAWDDAGSTRYRAAIVLPYTGRWRLKATHNDAEHPSTISGWSYLTVR